MTWQVLALDGFVILILAAVLAMAFDILRGPK